VRASYSSSSCIPPEWFTRESLVSEYQAGNWRGITTFISQEMVVAEELASLLGPPQPKKRVRSTGTGRR
jgi:hypothetical protein